MVRKDETGKYPTYAWPGGYPIFYVCQDCGILCPKCANENMKLDTGKDNPQWHVVASDIHWEGESLICDNCNAEIESAYGNPDEEE